MCGLFLARLALARQPRKTVCRFLHDAAKILRSMFEVDTEDEVHWGSYSIKATIAEQQTFELGFGIEGRDGVPFTVGG